MCSWWTNRSLNTDFLLLKMIGNLSGNQRRWRKTNMASHTNQTRLTSDDLVPLFSTSDDVRELSTTANTIKTIQSRIVTSLNVLDERWWVIDRLVGRAPTSTMTGRVHEVKYEVNSLQGRCSYRRIQEMQTKSTRDNFEYQQILYSTSHEKKKHHKMRGRTVNRIHTPVPQ